MDKRLARGALLFSLALLVGCSSKGSGSSSGGSGGGPGTGGGGPGTGGAGGGNPGSGGAAGGGPGTGGAPMTQSASVLQRNKNISRDGHFIDPKFTKAAAAKTTFDSNFMASFGGSMWASPLYVENGPGGKGVFIAVTTMNNVFAMDETSGAVVWMRNVGAPAMLNGPNANCGSIHPLGILATPAIDGASRTIYVSAAVGNATQILRQEVHALSVEDGSEKPGWPVDVAAKLGFDPQPHNPRSALSLVNGILYVAYGGHVMDCGDYHGRVVAIDTKDPTKVAGWATGGIGEAIWATGGMASDGTAVFAATGNRTKGGNAAHQDSEEVVRISGMATLESVYFPAVWKAMDNSDQDFGSSSPIVLEVPGATPSTMVVAPAKTGHVYFLDAKKLPGMGGELFDLDAGTGGFTAPTGYPTPKGMFVALTLGSARCPMGTSPQQVAGILVKPGAPAQPEIAWCAPATGRYSPIATTVDGKSEALVWFMNGSKLNAVDGETGQLVFNGGDGTCEGVIRWTSPIAVKGRIIVGSATRLCAWSVGQ